MTSKVIKPGLLARKVGMTQIFSPEGDRFGVTVLEVGPCVVTQIKTAAREGYHALQIGFQEVELRRLNKSERGHFEKKKVRPFRHLKEVRLSQDEGLELGQALTVNSFEVGERVDVTGVSKGKGFQGVIKRHHKAGGPASHGSTFHRSTGSIGQRTWPGRVFKLMKLPGHMGDRQVTVRNLKVVQVVPEKNYLVVEGAVPGATNSLVMVKSLNPEAFFKRALSSGEQKAAVVAENEMSQE